MSNIDPQSVASALSDLLLEAYFDAEREEDIWFGDEPPGGGFLKAIEDLTPEEASRKPFEGGDTIAAHCNHVSYYLAIANREFQGERAYPEADWDVSWEIQEVNEAAWNLLKEQLAVELDRARGLLGRSVDYADHTQLRRALALLAHGAWHQGAVQQLVPLVKGQ